MSYLIDVNVLIYAINADAKFHEQTRQWLDYQLADEPYKVGLPWPTLYGFVRIVTNPKLPTALNLSEAWSLVEDWLARPAAWSPTPTPRHAGILGKMLAETNASGDLVTDAHLATLASEHSLTVVSYDQDFARFADANLVKWLDPTCA